MVRSRSVERLTEPCGDTSFNEGKEEDETKDNWVSSLDVGFLECQCLFVWLFGGAVCSGEWKVSLG